MEKIKAKVRKQSEYIMNKVCLINSYLDIIEILNKNIEENNQVLYDYRGFFACSYYSIHTSIIIEIAKLLEKNQKDSFSIFRLFELFKKNNLVIIDKDIQDLLEEKIKELEESEIKKRIKKQRDKIFAHIDYTFMFDIKRLQAQYPIKNEDIKDILRIISDISNVLLSIVGGNQIYSSYLESDDIKKLINTAEIGIKMKDEYIKKYLIKNM